MLIWQSKVYRALSSQAVTDWKRVCRQPFFLRLSTQGSIIQTDELAGDRVRELGIPGTWSGVLQHVRIPFVSYPYEWSFSMLRAAALLHLEILTEAIQAGTILKDASPYNVQFHGARPVFIDIGSFVALTPGEPWIGYRQFCEMMLFPLLLQAYRRIDIQPVLRANLDGISAREFLRSLSWRDMLRPGVFTHGWVQSVLERTSGDSHENTAEALKSSGFGRQLILNNLARLTTLIRRLNWKPPQTQWTDYRHELPHVVADAAAKSGFVQSVCLTGRRQLVWDLGCNDGHFSRIAACNAEYVVAMDQDHGCVERLYRQLASEGSTNILPLCIDLLNPSPAQGWRGRERVRLEERGQPNLVLCLGLIHHLVIAGNIPLPEVVDWLASLNAEVVLEFPSKLDPMVQGLLRNKRDQYEDYSLPFLEATLLKAGFQIRERTDLPSGERTLLYLIPQ
ncbi:MAG: class I SAM-dependent methyltransferase [Planctomycetes bacterium]|nr:class I SAM-dependent methyltransferase [Planctomycetota bacterium]